MGDKMKTEEKERKKERKEEISKRKNKFCCFLHAHAFANIVSKYITNEFRFCMYSIYTKETLSDIPYDIRDHFTRLHSRPHKNGDETDPRDFALKCTCNRIVVYIDNRTDHFKNNLSDKIYSLIYS